MDDSTVTAAPVAATVAPTAEALSAIDEIAAQFNLAEEAAKAAPTDAVEETAPTEETPEAVEAIEAAVEETTEDAPAPEPTPEDRGIARLVEREVAVRALEEQVNARTKTLEATEARLKELETKAASYEGDFHEALRLRPTEALKAAGHDPEQVVRLYLAEKFRAEGKPIPEKLQREVDKAQDAYERQQFRQEQINFQRQQQAAVFVSGIEAGAREYVSKGISKDAPTVAEVAKAAPDRVYREIMDEIAIDAQSRSGKDTSTNVITYEEAAKRVEARWQDYRALLLPKTPTPDASTTVTTAPVSKVIKQGASATATKPPGKPLTATKKPQTEDELMAEGIAAGVAEHKRQQTANRPSR